MRIRLPVNDKIVTWTAYWLCRLLAWTVRVRVVGEEFVNGLDTKAGDAAVLATWHGRTFVPVTRYGRRRFWAIVSTSRDGNLQAMIFERMGFQTVRGSTSARGAVEAVLMLRRELRKGGVLVVTPDGPRGPRGVLHPGAMYLAQKVGCPLVVAGASSFPSYVFNSWDRYQLPLPFARGTLVYGEPIHIPADLDDKGRQLYADAIGEYITRLEKVADEFARTGRMRAGTVPGPQLPAPGTEAVPTIGDEGK